MQSTKVPNHIESGSNEQVISIPENDLRIEFAKLSRADRFDAALGSYRHERRRLDQAVFSFEPPRARSCAFIGRSYFKHWRNLGNDRTARKQSIVSAGGRFALAAFLLGSDCARFCRGDLATLYAPTRSNCRSRYLGLSLARSPEINRCRIWSHQRPKFRLSRVSLLASPPFCGFSRDYHHSTFPRGFGRCSFLTYLEACAHFRVESADRPRCSRSAGIGWGRDLSPAVADNCFRERYPARSYLRVCRQHYFLSANAISCLFFSEAPAHGHGCICDSACLYRNLSRFDQTEFWSGFAFGIVANHCLVWAEWLVVAKGLVFSRVRL